MEFGKSIKPMPGLQNAGTAAATVAAKYAGGIRVPRLLGARRSRWA